jgi:hypothetical protein
LWLVVKECKHISSDIKVSESKLRKHREDDRRHMGCEGGPHAKGSGGSFEQGEGEGGNHESQGGGKRGGRRDARGGGEEGQREVGLG